MKPTSNLDELPLAQDVCAARNGHPAEFIFSSPDNGRDRRVSGRWLLAVVSITAVVFLWACWSFVHAPQTPLAKPALAVIGSLAMALLASVAMVGTALRGRQAAS